MGMGFGGVTRGVSDFRAMRNEIKANPMNEEMYTHAYSLERGGINEEETRIMQSPTRQNETLSSIASSHDIAKEKGKEKKGGKKTIADDLPSWLDNRSSLSNLTTMAPRLTPSPTPSLPVSSATPRRSPAA